ncbi:MAG TPA: hypothetical protein VHV78_06875 [Gemmatimonadaceae bacterium]|nr:hypothetical protein [Gemmatimonadaceae bacterium]
MTTAVQFDAAYVPLIVVPLSVPDTVKGQLVGMLGVRISDTPVPLIDPDSEPPLLLAALANVVAQVPDRADEDCVRFRVIVPAPARLSCRLPDQLPLMLVAGDVLPLLPQASAPTSSAILKSVFIMSILRLVRLFQQG